MFKKLVLIIVGIHFLIPTACMAEKDNRKKEIVPFVSDEIILTEPERICEYEGIETACNQLLVYFFKKNDDVRFSTRDNIIGLNTVLSIIESNEGIIVGQDPRLAMIQVEVKPEHKLWYLKSMLKKSPYVKSVLYNMIAVFE